MERKKNIFDKIGSLIPGYRGYAERDSRRNCDKLLRNHIAQEIGKCELSMNEKIKIEVRNKRLDLLQDLEECRKKLNTLSDKIRYAPYGESSFFGDVLIKEDELKKIYQLDHDMLLFVDKFYSEILDLDIMNTKMSIDSLNRMLNDRNNFIKEHK